MKQDLTDISDLTKELGLTSETDDLLDEDIFLEEEGIDVEIIDLRTILPWDRETVINSVKKTGKCIVTHEAPLTCGFGAELVSKI